MPKRLLFLCTGNYYRSRFAEILFNHLARVRRIDWIADSRGLAREFGDWNVGSISPYTRAAVSDRNIACDSVDRLATHCYEEDLRAADRIIALKEAEHRPLLAEHFSGWESRVEYWHVHDLDGATPDQALSEIEELVGELVEKIAR